MRSNSVLDINLNNLNYNFSLLRDITSAEIIFMVKADAYGHGICELAAHAYQTCKTRVFGVADIEEAKALFEYFTQSKIYDFSIYVFSNPCLENEIYKEIYSSGKIFAVINSFNDLSTYLKLTQFKAMPLIVKFNTGMNRLGFDLEDYSQLITILKEKKRTNIFHLMTHFSSSYLLNTSKSRTTRQLNSFKELITKFSSDGFSIELTSCSNSGAIEQKIEDFCSHVRPGLMLYGPQSFMDKKGTILWRGKNLSTLKTTALKIIKVTKGCPIGYGGQVCSETGEVLFIPLGYGDGILTYYSGATINIGKIFGRINMDLTAIFLNKNHSIKIQDTIELWNEDHYSINTFANSVKTSPYQVMCALTPRVGRNYIS